MTAPSCTRIVELVYDIRCHLEDAILEFSMWLY